MRRKHKRSYRLRVFLITATCHGGESVHLLLGLMPTRQLIPGKTKTYLCTYPSVRVCMSRRVPHCGFYLNRLLQDGQQFKWFHAYFPFKKTTLAFFPQFGTNDSCDNTSFTRSHRKSGHPKPIFQEKEPRPRGPTISAMELLG